MNQAETQDWLDRYVAAWRSNDPDEIGSLFSDDVAYRYYPFSKPLEGRDAVVRSWLENPDEPASWEARYAPYAIQGNKVVATGVSRYFAHGDQPEKVYDNCFLIEFDADGNCRSFTEFFVKQPDQPA
ncbi:MAG: nuclear transport factor 2 family protein [Acidimicrobiia bacterium]